MIEQTELELAVQQLKKGGIIILPTETVYALAGDANNLLAIKRIFRLKNRPLNQSLSVLLAENPILERWACDISPLARKLALHFWPGPLTLVLKKKETVLSELTGNQSKIGLRVPAHPIAQAVLKAFGEGVAAPSANRSTHFSPTRVEHVQQTWSDQVDLILDGGACSVGMESTLVDMTGCVPRVLRLGAISVAEIQAITHSRVIEDFLVQPLSLSFSCKMHKERLIEAIRTYLDQGKVVTVLAFSPPRLGHSNVRWVLMPTNVYAYRQLLYKCLHEAKYSSSCQIFVEMIPNDTAWKAIRLTLAKFQRDLIFFSNHRSF